MPVQDLQQLAPPLPDESSPSMKCAPPPQFSSSQALEAQTPLPPLHTEPPVTKSIARPQALLSLCQHRLYPSSLFSCANAGREANNCAPWPQLTHHHHHPQRIFPSKNLLMRGESSTVVSNVVDPTHFCMYTTKKREATPR